MEAKLLSAQEIQDSIFRRMTADEKIRLGSGLWKLWRDLAKKKVTYLPPRSGIYWKK